MTDALDIATRLFFLGAAALFFIAAALLVGVAWITLTRRLDARRWAIRDRDDARRERELLDKLAPGRARLADAVTTPDPATLHDIVGPIDWPQEDQ